MAESDVVLDNPARWKAVAHPLRLAILRVMKDREMTNEELANELGVASGKLYFHTKKLLDAGLIEPAGLRPKGPLMEKLYRRTHDEFKVPVVEDGSTPPLAPLLSNALSVYENTWREHHGGDFTQLGYHLMYSLTRDEELEFFAKVQALAEEYITLAAKPRDGDTRLVSLALLYHDMDPLSEEP